MDRINPRMWPLLLSLNGVDWKKVAGAGAAVAVVVLISHDYLQGVALKEAELAYKNPRVVAVTRVMKVSGPVRVVTRVVEVAGRKETTTEEVRGPVTEMRGTETLREPVFPPAAPPRWVVGPSFIYNKPAERGSGAVWGGVSLAGRLDVLAGVTGKFRPGVMVLWRF